MSSRLEQLSGVIARTVRIDGIRFDSDNSVSLDFDGVLVTLVVIEDRLVLQAELGRLSEFPETAPLSRFLLEANDRSDLAGDNCFLATDRTANSIELCCTIMPLCALDEDSLARILARFLELVRRWGLRLNEFALPPQDAGTSAQAPGSLV